jgi:Cenp-O kinetochore centromere component
MAELLAIGYDLSGVCVFEFDRDIRTVRLRTSYRSRYLDSFYVVLRRLPTPCSVSAESALLPASSSSSSSSQLVRLPSSTPCYVLTRHSVPAFIPLGTLQQRHLPGDVQVCVVYV